LPQPELLKDVFTKDRASSGLIGFELLLITQLVFGQIQGIGNSFLESAFDFVDLPNRFL
jgi:hypothetical protein